MVLAPICSRKDSKASTYLIGAGLCASFALLFFWPHPPVLWLLLAMAAILAWLRLDLAVALLPLTFPYYLDLLPLNPAGSLAFSPSDYGIFICLGVALLRSLLLPEGRQTTCATLRAVWQSDRPLLLAALLFLLGASLALLASPDQHESLRAYREQIIEPLLYLLLILRYIRTRIDLARLIGSLIVSALIAAWIAIAQGLFHISSGLLIVSATSFRVDGPYADPNNLAFLFDRTLPILLALLLSGLFRCPIPSVPLWRDPLRWLSLVALLPILWALFWTDSHGSEVALLVVFLLLVLFEMRHRLAALVAAGVVAVGTGLFYSHVIRLFNAPGHGLLSERLLLWKAGWLMVRDSFLLGSGLDSFNTRYQPNSSHSYALKALNGQPFPAAFNPHLSHPHNLFLDLWISSGLLGLLAFLLLLGFFAVLLVRSYRICKQPVLQRLLLGIAGGMLAGLIHGLVDNFYFAPDLALMFWLFIAVALVAQPLFQARHDQLNKA